MTVDVKLFKWEQFEPSIHATSLQSLDSIDRHVKDLLDNVPPVESIQTLPAHLFTDRETCSKVRAA